MATYLVKRYYVYVDTQEVEAESQTEALEIAEGIEPEEQFSYYLDNDVRQIGE